MKQRMKELLKHLVEQDLSTKDVVKIISSLKDYEMYRNDFRNSISPEGDALARWGMDDARRHWRKVVETYNLPTIEVDDLY